MRVARWCAYLRGVSACNEQRLEPGCAVRPQTRQALETGVIVRSSRLPSTATHHAADRAPLLCWVGASLLAAPRQDVPEKEGYRDHSHRDSDHGDSRSGDDHPPLISPLPADVTLSCQSTGFFIEPGLPHRRRPMAERAGRPDEHARLPGLPASPPQAGERRNHVVSTSGGLPGGELRVDMGLREPSVLGVGDRDAVDDRE